MATVAIKKIPCRLLLRQSKYISRNARKRTFGHVRPAKIQISVSDQNIHRVHFGRARTQSFCMWTTTTLIRLCECAGWFESLLGAHVRRYFLSRRCGSHISQSCFHKSHDFFIIVFCQSIIQYHGSHLFTTSLAVHFYYGRFNRRELFQVLHFITKTCLYNLTPLNPSFIQ